MVNKIHKIMRNNVRFFLDHAYDDKNKVFYSEVDNDGTVQNTNIHIIGLSRLVYGLMEASSVIHESHEEMRNKAYEAVIFIKKYMIGKDKYGPYFIPTVNEKGEPHLHDGLNIWEQSYGFNGLVTYYEKTHNPDILEMIHELFDAYVKRFHDDEKGGFVFNYSLDKDKDYDSKCLQTIMYPVTSFQGRLYLVDVINQEKYEPWLKEAYKLGHQYLYDFRSNTIKVTLDRHLNGIGDKEVLPGHFFQLAWFFMSSKKYKALLGDKNLYAYGYYIYLETLKKTWMKEALSKGLPESINTKTGEAASSKRIWWEHSEWINAMCHLNIVPFDKVRQVLQLFENMFVDYDKGCEFFAVNEQGEPEDMLKGDLGKSSYHTIEMCKFILDRLSS